ncbi:hypothetical protein SADUNF_Sadunf01G0083100 [Salix dunnii]|uniref:Uncharacterized protein n=1 Tax=Salix dunnii TaxID=1413687 RepID=A0A835NAY9_9ROSI|nr:hypothetical protein SADUNF_Sadunf01G0083100 [Salix dunnii]
MKVRSVMVTGDNWGAANSIAKKVGNETVVAEAKPEQKAEKVKELQLHKPHWHPSSSRDAFPWRRTPFTTEDWWTFSVGAVHGCLFSQCGSVLSFNDELQKALEEIHGMKID